MISLLLLSLAQPARAQDGLDAHGFDLAAFDGDPRSPLSMNRPSYFGGGDYFVGGLLEYANLPLVYVTEGANGELVREPALDNLFVLNLSGGYAPMRRLRVDVYAPIFLSSVGEEGAPQGFAFGDMRVSAMGAILQPGVEGGFGLGVVPFVVLPTGAPKKFLGNGGVAGGGSVAATYERQKLTVGAELGLQFNPGIEAGNLTNPDRLTVGLSGGWLLRPNLGLNLEAHLALPFEKNVVAASEAPAEIIASLRNRTESGIYWTAGGAAAVSRGAGAAQYRFFLGGGWGKATSPAPLVVDSDGDMILDPVDSCPTVKETVNLYKDEDGCPDSLANLSVTVRRNQQNAARADVGVEGTAEPLSATYTPENPSRWEGLMPGTVAKVTARNGECLAGAAPITLVEGDNSLVVELEPLRAASVRVEVVDPTGAAVPGAQVTWGREPGGCVPVEPLPLDATGTGKQPVGVGRHTIFVTAPSFSVYTEDIELKQGDDRLVRVVLKPAKVQLEQKRIVILDKVFFDYNSATIQAVSYELLDQVANTLKATPDILLVEVAGHTDSDGNDNFNLELSQRRVEAVLQYLVARGVAPERLVAKGYGESRPVANNRSPDGKAKNRRVEFQILKREGDADGASPAPAETPGASLKPAEPAGK